MKAIPLILFALLTAPTILCQENLDLGSDGLIFKAFSENEIRGLESMVRYVDNMVTTAENKANINSAYHLFFEKIAQSTEYNAPFEETKKYPDLSPSNLVRFQTTDIQYFSVLF